MVTTSSSIPTGVCPALPERVLLSGIAWETYERIRDDLDRSGRRLKLTYDNGELEIEEPGKLHEVVKTFVRMILESYLLEHDIPFEPLSATTWKRELKAKGLEADESYYIQSVSEGSRSLNVDVDGDAVPDLAIEIEVTSPLLKKLDVYAGLGVAEIWHIRTETDISILCLAGGSYVSIPASKAVPFFTADVLRHYIALRLAMSSSDAFRRFRDDIKR